MLPESDGRIEGAPRVRSPAIGKFSYSTDLRVEIEDRALAHLQVVIANKLRRGEAFVFTWREDVSVGSGRVSVWVHPGVAMSFKYHGSRGPSLNRAWVEALAITANSPTGLYLVPEPTDTGEYADV